MFMPFITVLARLTGKLISVPPATLTLSRPIGPLMPDETRRILNRLLENKH